MPFAGNTQFHTNKSTRAMISMIIVQSRSGRRQTLYSVVILFTFLPFAGVVNRGDSFRRRRSRSNSLAPVSPVRAPVDEVLTPPTAPIESYCVFMIGAPGVGKGALLSQFRSSECINAYDTRGKNIITVVKLDVHVCMCVFDFIAAEFDDTSSNGFSLRFYLQSLRANRIYPSF